MTATAAMLAERLETARAVPESWQPEDPGNVMLSLFERAVGAVVDCGLAPQARTIFDRLIPAAKPPESSLPPAGVPDSSLPRTGVSAGPCGTAGDGGDDAPPADAVTIELTRVVTLLRRLRTHRLSAAEHEAIDTVRRWAVAELHRRDPRNQGTRVEAAE